MGQGSTRWAQFVCTRIRAKCLTNLHFRSQNLSKQSTTKSSYTNAQNEKWSHKSLWLDNGSWTRCAAYWYLVVGPGQQGYSFHIIFNLMFCKTKYPIPHFLDWVWIFAMVLLPLCPPVDLHSLSFSDILAHHKAPASPFPPPARHAFPSTRVDITMEACMGLLICSQLQPCKLLHREDFKLLWNREKQPETLGKHP